MFQIKRFLDDYSIPFVEEGANVSPGNINIKCPLCGDDPSEHMGISLQGKGWGCWRDQSHRGKSFAVLIANLLHVPYRRAQEIEKEYSGWGALGGLATQGKRLIPVASTHEVKKNPPVKEQSLPSEFVDLLPTPFTRGFRIYLHKRGVEYKDARNYGLKAALSGPWGRRVIFPVYENGKLITWTGRTILPTEPVRYKAQSIEQGAIHAMPETLWPYDLIAQARGDKLLVCEGPLDALKINIAGNRAGIYAVALSTAAISNRQIRLLHQLSRNFNGVYLSLDQDSAGQKAEHHIRSSLKLCMDVGVFPVPQGYKDAGELNTERLRAWLGVGTGRRVQ